MKVFRVQGTILKRNERSCNELKLHGKWKKIIVWARAQTEQRKFNKAYRVLRSFYKTIKHHYQRSLNPTCGETKRFENRLWIPKIRMFVALGDAFKWYRKNLSCDLSPVFCRSDLEQKKSKFKDLKFAQFGENTTQ